MSQNPQDQAGLSSVTRLIGDLKAVNVDANDYSQT